MKRRPRPDAIVLFIYSVIAVCGALAAGLVYFIRQ